MDFNQVDIQYFLKESIPFHFRMQNPLVFEDFIKYIFEVDGFTVLPKDTSPELTGMITAEKDDSVHLIYPVHQKTDRKVGVKAIQKAVVAMEILQNEHSWVITNGTFTNEGKTLADESGIELWDWDALHEALGMLFFDGKDPMEVSEEDSGPLIPAEIEPYLKMKVTWQAGEGIGSEWYNLGITLSNPTDRNIYLHLDLPALIDPKRNQIMADQWGQGEFVAGMLYGGASIRTNALFATSKLGERPPGGRIVLTCHERMEKPVTYHLNARLRGQACFIVTYCYTTNSPEYTYMTRFRDEVLSELFLGRQLITFYYFFSSRIVALAIKYKWLDSIVRKLGTTFIPPLIKKVKSYNSFIK